jgi:hypothetical protein
MPEVIESIEQQPGTKPIFLANQFLSGRVAPPDSRAAIRLRPYRYDPWGRVPPPKPFVLDRPGRTSALSHCGTLNSAGRIMSGIRHEVFGRHSGALEAGRGLSQTQPAVIATA